MMETTKKRLDDIRERQARCARPDRDDVPQRSADPLARELARQLRQAQMDRGFLLRLLDGEGARDDGNETVYALPADALRHLPLLIEAAKGIVNVYTWRSSKGYTAALQQGVAELQAALKPFALVEGSQTTPSELRDLVREYLTIDPSKDVERFCEVEKRLEQIVGIGTKRKSAEEGK